MVVILLRPALRFAALGLAILPAALHAQTPMYSVDVLPSHLPTQGAHGDTLNGEGQAVGNGIESLVFEAAFWPDPQTVVNLHDVFGFASSSAHGLDDAGTWVGSATYNDVTTKEQAIVVRPGEQPEFLPALVDHPLIGSVAVGISNNGLIVGASDTVPTILGGNPQRRAVLWTDDGALNLGTLGGDVSQAFAVNDQGLVVGVSNLAPQELIRAFAWTADGGMVQLPGLVPGGRTVAADVNADGLIVGDADLGAIFERAAVAWPDPSTVVPLLLVPGDLYAEAAAVNDHGQIVGRGRVAEGFDARLWHGIEAYDLSALHDQPHLWFYSAVDINRHGQILVLGFDTSVEPLFPITAILTPDLLWEDLGAGLAGTHGVPRLAGLGNLLPDGPLSLRLDDAPPGSVAFLVVGFSALNAPFKGGTLVPNPTPPSLLLALPVDASGGFFVEALWPDGVPPGVELYHQAWIADPGAPFGFSASNALRSTSP